MRPVRIQWNRADGHRRTPLEESAAQRPAAQTAEKPVTDDSLPGYYLRPRSIGGGDVGRTVPGAAEIGMTAGNEQVEDFDVVLVTHAFYANRTWTNGCYPLASRSRRFMVVFQLRMVMDLYSGEEMTALNRLRPSSALRRCE